MLEKIMDMVAEILNVDKNIVKPESDMIHDLEADSLDIVQMLIAMENQFDIEFEDEEIAELKTVGDVAAFIERKTGK